MALEMSHKSLMGSTSEEEPLTHGSKLLLSSCLEKKKGAGVHPSSRLLSVSPALVSGTLTVQHNLILVLEEYKKGSL